MRDVAAAVFGATGFIGRWVASELNDAGARLTLVVRDDHAARSVMQQLGIRGDRCAVDVADEAVMRQTLREVRPTVVFNLAGYGVAPEESDAEVAEQINSRLPKVIAECLYEQPAADWPGQRIVHVGTAFEYGHVGGTLDETGPTDPIGWYGRTKLAGTTGLAATCRRTALPGLTARLFTVYGPGEHPARLLPSLIAAAANSQRLPLTAGHQRRDFTYVRDVAEGLLRLAVSPAEPGAIVNLASGILTPVREFAATAADVLGIPPDRLGFGELPTRADEMVHEPLALKRLQDVTGWSPSTAVRDGIADTVRRCGKDSAGGP